MHLRCMTLFGLCAQDYFSRTGHELLDWLGFIFDPADAINFLWYTAEGNAAMAAATAVAIVPAAGSFIAKGTKQAIKAGKKAAQKAGEKAAKNATEKAAKKAAKKKLAKEAGKEAAEKGAEKAAKEAAEKATEKTAKETAEKTAKEAAEKGIKSGTRTVNGYNTTVNAGKQGKHIIGNNNYIDGRSVFNGTVDDAQRLVDEFAGAGEWIGTNKERVNFGKVIGQYIDPATNEAVETTVGIIHYSKTGVHIVPAQPK